MRKHLNVSNHVVFLNAPGEAHVHHHQRSSSNCIFRQVTMIRTSFLPLIIFFVPYWFMSAVFIRRIVLCYEYSLSKIRIDNSERNNNNNNKVNTI